MKKVLLIFTFAVCSLSSLAEDINALLLHLSTGNPVCFMLEKFPSIKFEGEELVINCNEDEIRYYSSEVKKITYSYIDPAGINNVELSQNFYYFDGKSLMVKEIVPNSFVYIYKSDGRLVSKIETDDKGNARIPLPAVSKEIFFVKTAIANFKITIR